jgi:hypothetical protein
MEQSHLGIALVAAVTALGLLAKPKLDRSVNSRSRWRAPAGSLTCTFTWIRGLPVR